MEEYEVLFLPSFEKCLGKHPHRRRDVARVIRRLAADPYHAADSHRLVNKDGVNLTGKRACHLFHGKFVLVFMICEECVAKGFAGTFNLCSSPPCTGKPDRRIICVAFDTHEAAYSKTWGV